MTRAGGSPYWRFGKVEQPLGNQSLTPSTTISATRLWQGPEALASYSFTHSIGMASPDGFANHRNTPALPAKPTTDRGDSDFDIRHAFTGCVAYISPSIGTAEFVRALSTG
jgi:hypothetical protein